MDVNALIEMLTDGLTADQAAAVRSAVERDTVKTKVQGLKQGAEYDTLQSRVAQMQAELDGDAASGRAGARAYQKWYSDNLDKIRKLEADTAAYQAKYGTLEAPNTQPPINTSGLSKEQIQSLIREEFGSGYAPKVADVVKQTGMIVQKHMLAGRKNPVDMDALDKLMSEKGLSLTAAYEEWDRPEREKVQAETMKADIERQVQERLQQERSKQQFPGGADYTPGSMSQRTKDVQEKFDPQALKESLARDWNSVAA